MAKSDPVSLMLDGLTFEQQLEELPELPMRPFLLQEDYPAGEELATRTQAAWQLEQWERERDAKAFLSGHNASPYGNCGPESPQQEAFRLNEAAEQRAQMYGLPDSPEDMPPQASGERQRPY